LAKRGSIGEGLWQRGGVWERSFAKEGKRGALAKRGNKAEERVLESLNQELGY